MNTGFLGPAVATVLTARGIETTYRIYPLHDTCHQVATVLTARGIETLIRVWIFVITIVKLQQYLPLAVLKPS